MGEYEAYANRDSLAYKELYGLQGVENMLRGTLRMPGFCKAWNALVQLGLTDDNCKVSNFANTTYSELTESFLPLSPQKKGRDEVNSVQKRLAKFLREKENSSVMKKLEWLGILKNNKIASSGPALHTDTGGASPAEILLHLLMQKWSLKPKDKDMVVMQHIFEFNTPSTKKKVQRLTSSMVVIGEDQVNTAMSKTVGLPMGISTKLILNKKINLTGVWIPTVKEIYNPVLEELEKHGIQFVEKYETSNP